MWLVNSFMRHGEWKPIERIRRQICDVNQPCLIWPLLEKLRLTFLKKSSTLETIPNHHILFRLEFCVMSSDSLYLVCVGGLMTLPDLWGQIVWFLSMRVGVDWVVTDFGANFVEKWPPVRAGKHPRLVNLSAVSGGWEWSFFRYRRLR